MTGQVPNPVFNKTFVTCYSALLTAKGIPFELKDSWWPIVTKGDRYAEAEKLSREVHSLLFKHIAYTIEHDGSDTIRF